MKQFDIKPFDPILCRPHTDDTWRPAVFLRKRDDQGFEVSGFSMFNYILKYTKEVECYIGTKRDDVGHWVYDRDRESDKIYWTYGSDDDNLEYIIRKAAFLYKENKKMKARDLVQHLNQNDMLTQRGTPYQIEGRGKFSILGSAWRRIPDGNQWLKDAVALSFVDDDGNPPWDR